MFFLIGRKPAIAIAAVAAFLATAVQAQQRIPLTLAEAEDLALENEPGTTAWQARADAFRESSIVAGALPDPTMRVALNNYPFEAGGFSTEGMTHALVGLRQTFPPGKSRSLNTQRFEAMAEEMAGNATTRQRDVLHAVRKAWLEAYYWQQAQGLVSESRPFFDDLAAISRSLYAVGRRNQQDVLRAELELSRLDDRLIEIDRQESTARAQLSEWIGGNASRSIATTLPVWDTQLDRDVLAAELLVHPRLVAADAQIAAREAGVAVAEEQYKPGWAVDLGYSYREGMLANGDPRSDFISLSVSVDLPFFGRKRRQDPALGAALAERRAAADAKEQLLRKLQSRLNAEFAHWNDLNRRVNLFEDRILRQSDEQAQAALLAYQSDRGDFADVMRGYIDNLNARLDHIRLQVDRAQSYAALANLGGIPR